MPSLSGYGPPVSSGESAHVVDVVPPPVVVLALDVVVGVVGDEPRAAATAAAAALSAANASRRVSFRWVEVMSSILSFMMPIEPDGCCRSIAAVSKDYGADLHARQRVIMDRNGHVHAVAGPLVPQLLLANRFPFLRFRHRRSGCAEPDVQFWSDPPA